MHSEVKSQIRLLGIPTQHSEQIPNTVNYVSRGQCTQRPIDPPRAANYGGAAAPRLLGRGQGGLGTSGGRASRDFLQSFA